jgi:superfamily II DNA or RNA helicase
VRGTDLGEQAATLRPRWREFEEARALARSLEFTSREVWKTWAKTADKPDDIPGSPDSAYRAVGWKGWGDWLGTSTRPFRQRTSRKPVDGYLAFEDARSFARSLRLTSSSQWSAWVRDGTKPERIPANPSRVYAASGWLDWSNWLGIATRATRRKSYLPFGQSRAFVHSLHLKNRSEWETWSRSEGRPTNIPATPLLVYKNAGWKGWGDWLGTGLVASQNRVFRPFSEARELVRALHLASMREWKEWSSSDRRPPDIPSNPVSTYGRTRWQGWADWLGTGTIATYDRVYRPFEQARLFARSLGLKDEQAWRAWSKSLERPEDVPATPARVYRHQGWAGMGDWLGTGNIAPTKLQFRPFAEAREHVHARCFATRSEWIEWAKSPDRPRDIPSNPERTYAGSGWIDYSDWLGTAIIANQARVYRDFIEARTVVRALGLRSKNDWDEWIRSSERPSDIPYHPERVYRDRGWAGWADWLAVTNKWNRTAILAFLRSLAVVLPSLDPSELYAIMRQNRLLAASENSFKSNRHLLTRIAGLASTDRPEELLTELMDEIEAATVGDGGHASATSSDDLLDRTPIIPGDEVSDESLPTLQPVGVLRGVDHLSELCPTADAELVEFFIAKAVGKLWRQELAHPGSVQVSQLLQYPAGAYAEEVRSRFLSQLTGAESLLLPGGYAFRVHDELVRPNLMQRLVSYRLATERRLGNWSGTGAGKTMAAVLASRVVAARLTVVVALNNTLEGWRQEILRTFPQSNVIVKERGRVEVSGRAPTYLLLNFEAFQQPDSSSMVERLAAAHKIDMVVLDEVHSVKQRNAVASKRRQVLGALLTLASERNPELRVLGMSATPVVNNLTEAVSLLEMVRGVKYAELDTRPTIPNVIAVHEKLVMHGVRYRPDYQQVLNEQCIEVQTDHVLDRLRGMNSGSVLAIEQALVRAKLPCITAEARPGTLVYTHYVDGIVSPVMEALKGAGLSTAEFTGEDKTGLERFKRREVDVLVGSSTLGTGIDGLQYVCNRLIVATLPWTHAAYEQLIGRVYRQGSAFVHVDVIIPQVVLRSGDDLWSWDVQRRERIAYKRTLADATVDGVIPEGVLESESAMLRRALDALHAWIVRLEQGDTTLVERQPLVMPLPEDVKRKIIRRFGQFSELNRVWGISNSRKTHKRVQTDPSEWYLYHTLYREARKGWTEVPNEVMTQWVKERPHLVVGDFGCGEALLAKAVTNRVYSFDHVAIDETVTACDMAETDMEDGVLDVAVFCLSLMGANYQDYLREAHRLLRLDGRLKIVEPAARWEGEKREQLLSAVRAAGFALIGGTAERTEFIYIDAMKM